MKTLLLVCLALTGCSTNAALRPRIEAARTIQDVDEIVRGRSARVFFTDGRKPMTATEIQFTPTHVALTPVFGNHPRVPLSSVERVELDVRRGRTVLWGVAMAAIGTNVGALLGRGPCSGTRSFEDGLWCSTIYTGVGFSLGLGSGIAIGRSRARRDPPVVVYQGPPDRYGVR